jgi:hypothetical protein
LKTAMNSTEIYSPRSFKKSTKTDKWIVEISTRTTGVSIRNESSQILTRVMEETAQTQQKEKVCFGLKLLG